MAFICYLGYPEVIFEAAVDVFGNIFYTVDLCRVYGAGIDIHSVIHPGAHDAEDQTVDLRAEHDIAPVTVLRGFPDAIVKDLTEVQLGSLFCIKVHLHV